MTRALLLSLVLAFPVLADTDSVAGVDVFGAPPELAAEMSRCFGPDFERLVVASRAGAPSRAREIEAEIEEKIRKAGEFASVDVVTIHYYESDEPTTYLTVNVTEEPGREGVTHLPEPNEDFGDPGALLATWREYEIVGEDLMIGGSLPPDAPCPVLHCLFGFEHQDLERYREVFDIGVPAHVGELARILAEDRDPEDRATAAYLLAHLPEARQAMVHLLPRLADPSPRVRNSVMRVLGQMAEHEDDLDVPVDRVVAMLASMSSTDRNKAMSILYGLAKQPKKRSQIVEAAGCDLLRLLHMLQPTEHEYAHLTLERLSALDLGARDYEGWRAWLSQQGVVCPSRESYGPKLCGSETDRLEPRNGSGP